MSFLTLTNPCIMDKSSMTEEQYNLLLDQIFPILAGNGPGATTMDLVARRLSMSKRTLYEIFGSKEQMLDELLGRYHSKYARMVLRIMSETPDMMTTMARVFLFHQRFMRVVNVNFFLDMDSRFPGLRKKYEENAQQWRHYVLTAFKTGVKQGVFRDDINYEVTAQLLRVQMESLKRMEEFFPKNITLVEAYNAIIVGMLRSIATPKGMEIVDNMANKFKAKVDEHLTIDELWEL